MAKRRMSIREIAQANRASGYHWFDNQDFHHGVCGGDVHEGSGGRYYFVERSRNFDDSTGWSVHVFHAPTGAVNTVGGISEIRGYDSEASANNMAERVARSDKEAALPEGYRERLAAVIWGHYEGREAEAVAQARYCPSTDLVFWEKWAEHPEDVHPDRLAGLRKSIGAELFDRLMRSRAQ